MVMMRLLVTAYIMIMDETWREDESLSVAERITLEKRGLMGIVPPHRVELNENQRDGR